MKGSNYWGISYKYVRICSTGGGYILVEECLQISGFQTKQQKKKQAEYEITALGGRSH